MWFRSLGQEDPLESFDKHLDCFHVLAIFKDAAVGIEMHVSF